MSLCSGPAVALVPLWAVCQGHVPGMCARTELSRSGHSSRQRSVLDRPKAKPS